jgi:hypothetical protein
MIDFQNVGDKFFAPGIIALAVLSSWQHKVHVIFYLASASMAKKWFTTTDLLLQFMKFLGCNVSAGK